MQARSYLTSGNCTCQAATGARAGKALDFIWKSGSNSYIYRGCPNPPYCSGAMCNPYNCTNTLCFNNGCAAARTGFCKTYGKECGNILASDKRCYGPQGQDPCPATCTKTTDDAVNKVIDYLISLCHPNCGNCIFERDFMVGALKTGWTSGLESIRKSLCSGASIGGMTQAAFIKYLGDRMRCSFISDKTFANCRGGCPGGTCNGKTCAAPKHLNANTCNCDDDVDPITKWFQGACHAFDFLPWGGCAKESQTVIFGGAALLGIILLFTIIRR